MDLKYISKAIAAGLTGAVIAVLAHYGFQPHAETVTALGVVIYALVGYTVGHLVTFLAPSNKPRV